MPLYSHTNTNFIPFQSFMHDNIIADVNQQKNSTNKTLHNSDFITWLLQNYFPLTSVTKTEATESTEIKTPSFHCAFSPSLFYYFYTVLYYRLYSNFINTQPTLSLQVTHSTQSTQSTHHINNNPPTLNIHSLYFNYKHTFHQNILSRVETLYLTPIPIGTFQNPTPPLVTSIENTLLHNCAYSRHLSYYHRIIKLFSIIFYENQWYYVENDDDYIKDERSVSEKQDDIYENGEKYTKTCSILDRNTSIEFMKKIQKDVYKRVERIFHVMDENNRLQVENTANITSNTTSNTTSNILPNTISNTMLNIPSNTNPSSTSPSSVIQQYLSYHNSQWKQAALDTIKGYDSIVASLIHDAITQCSVPTPTSSISSNTYTVLLQGQSGSGKTYLVDKLVKSLSITASTSTSTSHRKHFNKSDTKFDHLYESPPSRISPVFYINTTSLFSSDFGQAERTINNIFQSTKYAALEQYHRVETYLSSLESIDKQQQSQQQQQQLQQQQLYSCSPTPPITFLVIDDIDILVPKKSNSAVTEDADADADDADADDADAFQDKDDTQDGQSRNRNVRLENRILELLSRNIEQCIVNNNNNNPLSTHLQPVVIVLSTTNRPFVLQSTNLLSPDRVQRHITLPSLRLCDKVDLLQYFTRKFQFQLQSQSQYTQKRQRVTRNEKQEELNEHKKMSFFNQLANILHAFNPSDIQKLCTETFLCAIKRVQQEIVLYDSNIGNKNTYNSTNTIDTIDMIRGIHSNDIYLQKDDFYNAKHLMGGPANILSSQYSISLNSPVFDDGEDLSSESEDISDSEGSKNETIKTPKPKISLHNLTREQKIILQERRQFQLLAKTERKSAQWYSYWKAHFSTGEKGTDDQDKDKKAQAQTQTRQRQNPRQLTLFHPAFQRIAGFHDIIYSIHQNILWPFTFSASLSPIGYSSASTRTNMSNTNHILANISPNTGIILTGPSGCGKTYLALTMASALNLPVLNVSATSLISKLVGESEQAVAKIFQLAKSTSPCVLLLDNIEAICSTGMTSEVLEMEIEEKSGNQERKRVIAVLKENVDAFTSGIKEYFLKKSGPMGVVQNLQKSHSQHTDSSESQSISNTSTLENTSNITRPRSNVTSNIVSNAKQAKQSSSRLTKDNSKSRFGVNRPDNRPDNRPTAMKGVSIRKQQQKQKSNTLDTNPVSSVDTDPIDENAILRLQESSNRVLSSFLREIDTIFLENQELSSSSSSSSSTPSSSIFIIGTTRSVGELPPSLLRSGRLSTIMTVPIPDALQRFKILQFMTAKMPVRVEDRGDGYMDVDLGIDSGTDTDTDTADTDSDFSIDIGATSSTSKSKTYHSFDSFLLDLSLSKHTLGFSPSDLRALCSQAAILSLREHKSRKSMTKDSNQNDVFISPRHFIQSLPSITRSLLDLCIISKEVLIQEGYPMNCIEEYDSCSLQNFIQQQTSDPMVLLDTEFDEMSVSNFNKLNTTTTQVSESVPTKTNNNTIKSNYAEEIHQLELYRRDFISRHSLIDHDSEMSSDISQLSDDVNEDTVDDNNTKEQAQTQDRQTMSRRLMKQYLEMKKLPKYYSDTSFSSGTDTDVDENAKDKKNEDKSIAKTMSKINRRKKNVIDNINSSDDSSDGDEKAPLSRVEQLRLQRQQASSRRR